MSGFGYRFASRYRVIRGKKCFPPNSNSHRLANSRRQWFVPSPSSGDTAARVFQNTFQSMVIRAVPYQPKMIRVDLAPVHPALGASLHINMYINDISEQFDW